MVTLNDNFEERGVIEVRRRATGFVALAAIAVACSNSAAAPAIDTTPTTSPAGTQERPSVPAEPSAQVLRELRLYGDPAPLGAVQEQYGIAPVILDPGAYTFAELGIELTITLPDYWRLEAAEPGKIDLTRPEAELESLLPGLLFLRPVGFADPLRAPTGTLYPGSTGWEPWELNAWIEAMPQLIVLDQGTVTVDGRPTRWWDIDVDPALGLTDESCQPGACVKVMWTGGGGTVVARDLERIRWYEIPDPAGQIIVFVAGRDNEWPQLIADADQIVRDIRLGDSTPHPVPSATDISRYFDVGANTALRFSGIDGLTFTSATSVGVGQRPGEVTHFVRDDSAVTAFVLPALDGDHTPISSAADIVTALEGSDGTVIVERDAEILGMSAVVIDVVIDGDATHAAPLLLSEPRPGYRTDAAAWPTYAHNRVWVVDSPIGPAFIGASATSPDGLEAALGRIDFFADAIGFCPATESCAQER